MNGRRAALLVVPIGLLASQAGHLLAYELRFGAAAQQIQSSGAHGYFPALAKTGLGFLASALVAGLFVSAVARVLAGGRLDKESAPSYLRLLALLFTLQLAIFAAQETVEAAVSGSRASSAAVLMLWGTAGQLPVAAVAALAVRWLLGRLRPALSAIRLRLAPVQLPPRPLAPPLVLAAVPVAAGVAMRPEAFGSGHRRRGPPTS